MLALCVASLLDAGVKSIEMVYFHNGIFGSRIFHDEFCFLGVRCFVTF